MCAAKSSTQYSQYIIPDIPHTAYYIPNFITDRQQEELIQNIYSVPKPKWTNLSGRRLQNWGGYPHPRGMVQETIPKWLIEHINTVTSLGLFAAKTPNHVLINEYEPGEGILPHLDGPLYYPVVVNISLCAPIVMDFYDKISEEGNAALEQRYKFSFLLEPRSLLCLQNEMYETTLHGIDNRFTDRCENIKNINIPTPHEIIRQKRVSLTIRHVEKVLRVKLRLSN